VILEIDWEGARQVRQRVPDCTSVFILPPSRAELEHRLRSRRTDSDDVIARRLRDAVSDMSHFDEFDYVIVNDDFDRAVSDLRRIVSGQGVDLVRDRPALAPLVQDLLART
jgi:guanylate kinase